MDRKENRTRLITLFFGTVPFLIPVLIALWSSVTKNTLFGKYNGSDFDAFRNFKVIIEMYSVLYWPTYIIGAVLIVAAIKDKKGGNRNDPNE